MDFFLEDRYALVLVLSCVFSYYVPYHEEFSLAAPFTCPAKLSSTDLQSNSAPARIMKVPVGPVLSSMIMHHYFGIKYIQMYSSLPCGTLLILFD